MRCVIYGCRSEGTTGLTCRFESGQRTRCNNERDGMDTKAMLVAVLLDRLGGSVTVTEAEMREVNPADEIRMTPSNSFQDDTVRIELIKHGS